MSITIERPVGYETYVRKLVDTVVSMSSSYKLYPKYLVHTKLFFPIPSFAPHLLMLSHISRNARNVFVVCKMLLAEEEKREKRDQAAIPGRNSRMQHLSYEHQ